MSSYHLTPESLKGGRRVSDDALDREVYMACTLRVCDLCDVFYDMLGTGFHGLDFKSLKN